MFFSVPVKGGAERAFLKMLTENTQRELSFVTAVIIKVVFLAYSVSDLLSDHCLA